ncbi:TlpA family protein disulfide reductase [Bacteroides sp. 51]|uniref:TlpA family protein disulfide reductase n=1 Tax=Bacteroides sp. 51 TaxID=2302938 RepID=UPI0013D66705|nr:TlpA family protein disulfide reductase [Bacteroides sp. 51]NDV82947.1 hypothetical protein [Bacteroides sp. 51]
MKFTLPCIILFVLLFIQCDGKSKMNTQKDADMQSESTDAGFVHITGFIQNRSKYPDTKEMRLELSDISGEPFRISTPIDENGKFHFKFELNQAQDIRLQPYLDFLYVYPNDSLHVELDFEDLTKVQLSGNKAAEINGEFKDYFEHTFYRSGDYGIGTNNESNLSMNEIRRMLDDKKGVYYQKRNEFLQKTQRHEDVLYLTEAMIELDYYSTLIRVVLQRSRSGKEVGDLIVLKDEIDKKNTKYFSKELYSDSHFDFVGMAFVLNLLITPPDENFSISSCLQKVHFPNDTIKNFTLARYASIALRTKELPIFEELYPQIDHLYLNSRLVKEHQNLLEKINNMEIMSAAITGGVTDMQADISSKENLLSEIIARNKGKVQVIDIWATSCPPCIAEFPRYKELIDNDKYKDVAFSFICAGGDEQESYKILQKYQLSEIPNHCCTKEEFRSLSKTFSGISYPYGILVNKKGVIVDYGSHVRATLIEKKLDLLLKGDKLIE